MNILWFYLPWQPISSSLLSLQSLFPLQTKDGAKHLLSSQDNMFFEQIAPKYEMVILLSF